MSRRYIHQLDDETLAAKLAALEALDDIEYFGAMEAIKAEQRRRLQEPEIDPQ
jgi:hypothetical protein